MCSENGEELSLDAILDLYVWMKTERSKTTGTVWWVEDFEWHILEPGTLMGSHEGATEGY